MNVWTYFSLPPREGLPGTRDIFEYCFGVSYLISWVSEDTRLNKSALHTICYSFVSDDMYSNRFLGDVRVEPSHSCLSPFVTVIIVYSFLHQLFMSTYSHQIRVHQSKLQRNILNQAYCIISRLKYEHSHPKLNSKV